MLFLLYRFFLYLGQWENGFKHGIGTLHYPSGNIYHGSWVENRKEGQGTFKWIKLKEEYTGQFKNNIQEGLGRHTWFITGKTPDQAPFDNFYEGLLSCYMFDLINFAGSWVNGKRHGKGTFQYSTGASFCGEWSENMKVSLLLSTKIFENYDSMATESTSRKTATSTRANSSRTTW